MNEKLKSKLARFVSIATLEVSCLNLDSRIKSLMRVLDKHGEGCYPTTDWEMAGQNVRALLQYGFSVLKLNRIHASHLTRNPASGRVMLKTGMAHEGCARQHAKRWDRFEDLELYVILREQWIRNTEQRDGGDL